MASNAGGLQVNLGNAASVATTTPTRERRKSKNLMGLTISPSPRSSPLPSPRSSPFVKRKSFSISGSLFRCEHCRRCYMPESYSLPYVRSPKHSQQSMPSSDHTFTIRSFPWVASPKLCLSFNPYNEVSPPVLYAQSHNTYNGTFSPVPYPKS